MKSVLLIALMIFTFCSCSKNMSIPIDDKEVDNGELTSYSFLALGDSYTIGTSVPKENNYPSQLIDSLAERQFQAIDTDLLAVNGWTTTNLLTALESATFADKKFDLVTLLIGVNNQYQNKPFEIFETEFVELLDLAIAYANGNVKKVIVLSIPDYSVTPIVADANKPAVAAAIAQYNARKKEITESKNVTFIDITPISQLAADDSSLLAPDNLHPSASMYQLWISKTIDEVIDKIN